MSTLGRLKDSVLLYLQTAFPTVERHPLLQQGDDATEPFQKLFIRAANNARRNAEMQHDFQFAMRVLEGTIPVGTTGLSLEGLTEYGGVDTYDVKTIEAAYLVAVDGTFAPIRHESRGRMHHRLLEQEDRRTPDDYNCNLEDKLLVFGKKIYKYPTNTTQATSIALDACVWLADYTEVPYDEDATDDFIKYGFEYMQWATIVEMNHLVQTFVSRQEGSLAPPTKERDRALAIFIQQDEYKAEANRNIVLD